MSRLIRRYRELGRYLAYYRHKKGISQIALAQKVGISPSYLSKIECGNYNKSVSLTTVFDLAEGLGVHPMLLLQEGWYDEDDGGEEK